MEAYKDRTLSPDKRAVDLINRMTTKEKVGQLNQHLYGFSIYERDGDNITLTKEFTDEVEKYSGLGTLYGLYRADPWSKRTYETGIPNELAASAYNTVQRYVIEHSRLGIPMLLSTECPHGHQALDGYLLPVNLAMGATFNPNLVESAYAVCGKQLKSMGVDLALISVLDVLRDPRWGRSEECFSEDPYLSSQMAKSAVQGCQSQDVSVVAKHFCAQGECTGGVNASAARIGERELREIHLPSMKACCEVGVDGVMAAYNEIDGIPCHANKNLLTDILRGEMGFKGVIMADGIAVDCLDVITGDNVMSGAIALKSGMDISLWDRGFTQLEQALNLGYITTHELDSSVLRVLEMKFRRGLFESPYLAETLDLSNYNYGKAPQALELARESVVLLKNNEILPIDCNKVTSIAVIGPNADNIYNQLGDYTPPLKDGDGITLLQGIKKLVGNKVRIEYLPGCNIMSGSSEEIAEAVELAKTCDLTILALGGSSSRFEGAEFNVNGAAIAGGKLQMDCGEGVDCSNLGLCGLQNQLADEIFALGKPIVTVLIQGRPYAVPSIAEKTDALLCAFYPGVMGGQALAEIIFGVISPSGRLPVSIPRHAGQIPVYYNYKASYAGMNYHDEQASPLYSFGAGLSYTEFRYDNIKLSETKIPLAEMNEGKEIALTFEITNVGIFSSHSVPQLYIRDVQSSTVRRVKELKAFDKVLLQPDETKQASLFLDKNKLSIWDSNMQFTVEKGDFELTLSDSGNVIWNGNFEVV